MKATYGFSFLYDGKKYTQQELRGADNGAEKTGSVRADSNLTVTGTVISYPENQGIYWVTEYANTGTENTKILSQICDGDFLIAFDKPYTAAPEGYFNEQYVTVTAFQGSRNDIKEYMPEEQEIRLGQTFSYATAGGRSCNFYAPYFVVNCGESGVVIGLGWTGQWNASFTYTEEGIRVSYGIEKAAFYLKPGEKVRTGSVLLTEYDNGRTGGHNAFRRIMKQRCVLGKGQRPAYGRTSAMTWGAIRTDIMLGNIEALHKLDTGIECFFIDAGWYGHSTQFCKDEHEGDWARHTGSWNINPLYHPDGLREVSKKVHESGMELLLWVEPERAIDTSDWAVQHPEYMLKMEGDKNCLVNLGTEGAWQMVYDLLENLISSLDIQCYRQDFNMDPLEFWRAADEEDRCGLTEIKHVNGLYRLWDALLDRFPQLYIDNCASGGRRNDIEMLSRGIPLWRSDYQCSYNSDPEIAQVHGTGVSTLFPYSGTGINGPMEDTYEIRSCYGSALSSHNWWWREDAVVTDVPGLHNVRKLLQEYKEIRPLFSCDFYPLTEISGSKRVWCVWQYDDPATDTGVVMAFRRTESNVSQMTLQMGGLKEGEYIFINTDTGEEKVYNSQRLTGLGLPITLLEKRSSVVWKYRKK